MRRTQMCNHLNRNNLYENEGSLNSPEVVVTSLWLPDENSARNNVEIIELNTSDEIEDKDKDRTWAFNNEDNLRDLEDKYKINKAARERRRLRNQNLFTTNTSIDRNSEQFLRSDISGDYFNENKYKGSRNNCIRLRNKNIDDFDSSLDSNSDIEIVTDNNILLDSSKWNPDKLYDEEYETYDSELNKEKHTIWIYSYKNKSLLSDEFANGVDSSSSRSTENSEEHKENATNTSRLATPIPSLYIPRLILPLVPTLSTVTEISEVLKPPSSNESATSSQALQKRKNNWLKDIDKIENIKTDKSTNIVNWMALSPREKRRRTNYLEDQWNEEVLSLESPQKDQLQVQVKAEVHVNEGDKERSAKSTKPASIRIVNDDRITNAYDYGEDIECQIKALDSKSVHNSPAITSIDSTPKLRQSSRRSAGTETSEPFEKLETDWTHVTKVEKETATYDYVSKTLEILESDTKSHRNPIDKWWMKNSAPFMKPPEWDKYLSIDESNLSLHLSLGSIIQEREPWYRRLIRCLSCCK